MSPIRTVSRSRVAAAVAATGVLLVPAATAAQAPDRIDLPAGWQPEGITTDGSSLFAGSLADGAIWTGDPATGEGDVLVGGEDGTVTVGLHHDDAGRLWAAGGASGQVRVFDATSGELLGAYPFEAGFINDVAVTDEAAYFTDSFVPQLLVVPIGEDGSLAAPDEASALPLGGDLTYGDGFNLNGIEATDAGLVVIHSGEGQLYRVDPATGEASRIDSGDIDLTNGDGLELAGSTLYVVRNSDNLVTELEIDAGATAVTAVGEHTSEDFDVPTTVARVGDDLWAVNARFGIEAGPESEYWITRIGLGDEME